MLFYGINLVLEHYEDWTISTKKYNVIAKTKEFSITRLNDKIVNIELSRIGCINQKDCDIIGFISLMKNYKNVISLYTLSTLHNSMVDVVTIEDYTKSIRKKILESGGMFIDTIAANNQEYYKILVFEKPKRIIQKLKESLSNVSNIKSIEIIEDHTQLFHAPYLTPKELHIIMRAYNEGYFDYPKKVDLATLSSNLGLAKSTVDFHLRNGLKKLIEDYLK